MESPKVPYFCPVATLPAPLPTICEIESSTQDLPCIHNPDDRRNVLVGNDFVVKYGPHVQDNKGHALLLLERHAISWAPRLYAMYREKDKLYIVQERKAGQQLAEVWGDMNQDDIIAVATQLRSMFTELRSLTPPSQGPRYANASGGPLSHPFFKWGIGPDSEINGPFENEKQVVSALARRCVKTWEDAPLRGWFSEYLARHLPQLLLGANSMSVFTHADFQRKNIMVTKLQGSERDPNSTSTYHVTAVIDWENAGWYPSY